MHSCKRATALQSVIPMEKLKDFIAFARARCHPQLTDAAAEDLVNNYLQLRRAGSSRKVFSFTFPPPPISSPAGVPSIESAGWKKFSSHLLSERFRQLRLHHYPQPRYESRLSVF